MKYVLILFLIIIFASCDNRNGVKLILYNETYGVTLDSVRVSTSDKKATIKFTRIDAGDEKTGSLDISRVSKTGYYIVQSYAGEYRMVKNIAYYSNRPSLTEEVVIVLTQHGIVHGNKK